MIVPRRDRASSGAGSSIESGSTHRRSVSLPPVAHALAGWRSIARALRDAQPEHGGRGHGRSDAAALHWLRDRVGVRAPRRVQSVRVSELQSARAANGARPGRTAERLGPAPSGAEGGADRRGVGDGGALRQRGAYVATTVLAGCALYCVGHTRAGHPRHPLYVAKNALVTRYGGPGYDGANPFA